MLRDRPPECAGLGYIPGGTLDNVVTGTAISGLTVEEFGGNGILRQTKLTFNAVAFTITDNGANGSGGLKVYTFPIGVIKTDGGVANIAITYGTVTDANVIASVGSVTAAADATLTSTEANIIASTAAATTSGAGTFAGIASAVAYLDGTATAAAVFLNIATSTDPSTNNSMTLTGTLLITWTNLGDK